MAEAERPDPATWADRGWYLAVEYGVLARERFLKRLPRLRALGRFKELLEPGGAILYRNMFREGDIQEAWELLTVLRPWHDRLVCYLKGEETPLKEVHDVLWCSAFLRDERPCRGGGTHKKVPLGCPGARILVGPGDWDEAAEEERHAWTFAGVDERGQLVFDQEAIAAFMGRDSRNRRCPLSPARDPRRFAEAFQPVSVRSLDWPLIAELSPEVQKVLGKKALQGEHGFVLEKGQADLDAHAPLELRAQGETIEVRPLGRDAARGPSIGRDVRVPASVRRVLAQGVRLRGMRIEEDYVRRKGGFYDLEQRFVLSSRVRLSPTDTPDRFQGYVFSTVPRGTPEYQAWAQRVADALPGVGEVAPAVVAAAAAAEREGS